MGSSTSKSASGSLDLTREEDPQFNNLCDTSGSTTDSNADTCKIGNKTVQIGTGCKIYFQLTEDITCHHHMAFAFKDDCVLMLNGTDRIIEHSLRDEKGYLNSPHEFLQSNPERFQQIHRRYVEQIEMLKNNPQKYSDVIKDKTCCCHYKC